MYINKILAWIRGHRVHRNLIPRSSEIKMLGRSYLSKEIIVQKKVKNLQGHQKEQERKFY